MPPPRSPRRPSRDGGRLAERDGPRSMPPLRSPERDGRQGERDGPRAPPSTPRRGRMLERQRRHERYRNEKDGPHVPKFEEAPRGCSASFSPSSDRTEEQDFGDDQIVQSEEQHDEALMEGVEEPVAAEVDGGGEAAGSVAVEENGSEEAVDSVAAEEDGGEEAVVGSVAVEENVSDEAVGSAEEDRGEEEVRSVTHILSLSDDMILQILTKMSQRDRCRAVCCCRNILRVVRYGSEAQNRRPPFVAAVVMTSMAPSVVTMQKRADVQGVMRSVSYISASLMEMPQDTRITDCRSGFLLLKRADEKFYIWNPYLRRTAWVPVPGCEIGLQERYVASALVPGDAQGQFCLAAMYAQSDNSTMLRIYSSRLGSWRNAEIEIREHQLHPFSVHSSNFIYFLSLNKRNKSIVRIDHHLMTAVTIALPEDCKAGELMISRTEGELCLCKAEVKRIKGRKLLRSFRYKEGQWEEAWRHDIPEDSYWTRLIGFGEVNGLLIVGTGIAEMKVFQIEEGKWIDLQNCKISSAFALEMDSPFRGPFTLPTMDICG
ncbi:hypothetical protein SEVIR_6G163800v4 [Setaria viridis]|uniref:F-box domain-containing protein n=1 Tax=Setaria viridis TaxID=4556 RepID=A0A4U6U7B7_SETVI|nr:uncharacterized protein LOC117860290 isoform X2 [Setaria viridis]TKW10425.1 hypothetical protein SEVIR_6G163800v2 [Setaria viridis]